MAANWFKKIDSFESLSLSDELMADLAALESALRALSPRLDVTRFVSLVSEPGIDPVPGLGIPAAVGDGCFDLLFMIAEDEEWATIGREPCVHHVHGYDEYSGAVNPEPDDSWLQGLVSWAERIVSAKCLLSDVIPDQRQWGDNVVRYGATEIEITADSVWSACESAVDHGATHVRFAYFDGSYDRTVLATSPEAVLKDLGL